eukprot:Sdes_comp20663_c0_seq1m15987
MPGIHFQTLGENISPSSHPQTEIFLVETLPAAQTQAAEEADAEFFRAQISENLRKAAAKADLLSLSYFHALGVRFSIPLKSCGALHAAVQSSSPACVEFILHHQICPVNIRDESGRFAVHIAAQNGDLPLIRLLTAHGALLISPENRLHDSQQLLPVVQEGLLDILHLILDAGFHLDCTTTCGETALHIAASRGFFPLCKLLLQRAANPNQRDRCGRTPLQAAMLLENAAVRFITMRMLLQHGADLRVRDLVSGRSVVDQYCALYGLSVGEARRAMRGGGEVRVAFGSTEEDGLVTASDAGCLHYLLLFARYLKHASLKDLCRQYIKSAANIGPTPSPAHHRLFARIPPSLIRYLYSVAPCRSVDAQIRTHLLAQQGCSGSV